MKVTKTNLMIFLFTLSVFLVSEGLVLADQSHRIDAYVTDWKDTTYLIKNVRSDFQPNDPLSFYAYYGASRLTIPFSKIRQIIVTERIVSSLSENFSEAKYYSSGEIILTNNELLKCSWVSNGWRGYNKYDGLIFVDESSWREVKFGSFNDLKKKVKYRRFDNPRKATGRAKKATGLGKQGAYPYTIHVSSFRNKRVANSMAKKLRKSGLPAFVCPAQIPNRGKFHRIFIGFYKTFRETKKAALKLKGIKYLYPLEAKMPYAVQLGTFNSDQKLKKLEADLQSKTYLTYTVPDTTENHKTKLLFGAFRTKKETARYTEKLQNEGFDAKVVKR